MKTKLTITMIIICLSFLKPTKATIIYLNDGQTHDIDYQSSNLFAVSRNTTLNLLDDAVVAGIWTGEGGIANIYEGAICYELKALDGSELNIYGGNIYLGGTGFIMTSPIFNISGGTIYGSLWIWGGAFIVISGGQITDEIWVWDIEENPLPTIAFVGSNFAIDGIPVSYGEINLNQSATLTGQLFDGSTLDNYLRLSGEARIILHSPEPATLLLLGLGSLMLKYYHHKKGEGKNER